MNRIHTKEGAHHAPRARILALLCGALVALSLMAVDREARGQVGPLVDEPWEEFRARYNQEQYSEAIPYAIEAIQRNPDTAEYYLGLARAYFWLEQPETAVFYYDIYLRDFGPELPAGVPVANRVPRVSEERGTANSARPNPNEPARAPEAQDSARAVLLERLESDAILTTTGGGAYAVYQGLLRSGYARPDLPVIQERVANALLEEALLFVQPRRTAMPSLAFNQWETQRSRVRYWRDLVGARAPESSDNESRAETQERIATLSQGTNDRTGQNVTPTTQPAAFAEAQIALCEGQMMQLNQSYERAAEQFTLAVALDRDLLPAHMGLLNALWALGVGGTDRGTAALEAFVRAVERVEDADPDVVLIYRAVFASQARRHDEAIRAISEVFGLR